MNKLYGVINGGYKCNFERVDELNQRINQRMYTTQTLPANYNVRPVSTKYDIMPIVDKQPRSDIMVETNPVFNTEKTFYPGTQNGPWSGFSSNINTESILRNQVNAIQSNPYATFIPSSESDLYNNDVVGRKESQNHPLLFEEHLEYKHNPNVFNLGNKLFQNCTKTDIKNIK